MFIRSFLVAALAATLSPCHAAELSFSYSRGSVELTGEIGDGYSGIQPPSIYGTAVEAGTMSEFRFGYRFGSRATALFGLRSVDDLTTRNSQYGGPKADADALMIGFETRGDRHAGFAAVLRFEVSRWDVTEPGYSPGQEVQETFTSAGVALGVELLATDRLAFRVEYQRDFIEPVLQHGLALGIRYNIDSAHVF